MSVRIAFTGGGTAGHIYPGLAVCDELKNKAFELNFDLQITWIGCSRGMDKKIVTNAVRPDGTFSADFFKGIPSGKLRRYFSFKNVIDVFKIFAGFAASFFILAKLKPSLLFSKGGFVSVPPCIAAKLLKIPVITHECDFTPGLANRINAKSAKLMLLSYEDTKKFLSESNKSKSFVTGNPVRPVFYNASSKRGLEFIDIPENHEKPVLLVLGGSSGALQINKLVTENLDFLCKKFIVVHQTGMLNTDESQSSVLKEKYRNDYKPFSFIYKEMPDVVAACDVVLSRAGANSIWECAVLSKPMILIPLCGNGTRGDQVDNAKFFEEKGCAKVLLGNDADSKNLQKAVDEFTDKNLRKRYSDSLKKLTGNERPSEKIADLIMKYISSE
ncbi:MAG: UDP-N-acetylglucosamine--N-acetylmuramyl-(pentapeptide) pyrophosphoryl-undecaprenol N-acetylglucosamine transferase [Treponema sp.]|nr:UDP-N-acetylglucosamine--N-acetylmuramyl-(pentapeptide) pyrophosphoryl-undecaprenol N-acetylglucosamine transferase [Treponema sp.]